MANEEFGKSKFCGEYPTLEPPQEDKLEIRLMKGRVTLLTRNATTSAVRSSMKRVQRERKRMVLVPCTRCIISSTCDKRKTYRLKGCKYAIVATAGGAKSVTSACFAHNRVEFKKLANIDEGCEI